MSSPRSLQRWYGRRLARIANAYLEADDPRAAWRTYQRFGNLRGSKQYWWMRGVCQLAGFGDFDRAHLEWCKVNELRHGSVGPWRVLGPVWIGAIGHIGQMDWVVKQNILEGRGPENIILYLPERMHTPNMFFLSQYLPFMTVVSDPQKLPFNPLAAETMEVDILCPRVRDGNVRYWWAAAADVQREWERQGRAPLLKFPEDLKIEGWRRLGQLGMQTGDWFATLHVRESSRNQMHRKFHELRNTVVEDYVPAIKAITDRGGWVVRMGDVTMTKLPVMDRVIDYPFQAYCTDMMDIFLLSENRFHIGSPSGLSYVAWNYGVPSVMPNYWCAGQRPIPGNSIFVPKLCYDADGRMLTLEEICSGPLAWVLTLSGLDKKFVVENSDPEDIRSAVREMMDRLDGLDDDTLGDKLMQRAAHITQERNRSYGDGKIARDFLRRHREFVQ